MGDNPLQIIFFLIGFGAIIFLTYVTTRFIAGKSNRMLKGKHIQIIETVSLGLDKRIHLIKAGNQHILVSSTSKHIEFLSNVDIGEAETTGAEPSGMQNVFNFKELFDKYVGTYKNRNIYNTGKSDPPVEEAETGSFRSNLGRLKTIVRKTDQVEKDGDDITNEK